MVEAKTRRKARSKTSAGCLMARDVALEEGAWGREKGAGEKTDARL